MCILSAEGRGENDGSLFTWLAGLQSQVPAFLKVLGKAVAKPIWDSSPYNYFDSAAVEFGKRLWRPSNFPWSSGKVEATVCFHGVRINVVGPVQIIGDVYRQETRPTPLSTPFLEMT